MLQPDGFLLGKCLASNERNQIHAAVRERDGRQVVLKTATSSMHASARLRREFEVLRMVQGDGIVEAIDLLQDGTPVLVLAQVPGMSLASWVSSAPLSVDSFLDLAVQVADGLTRVHAKHWIHCDVTPGNLMIDPVTRRACIIDFGIAQPLGAHARSLEAGPLAVTLPYIAPEQTGRMNHGIDPRSDLYSLGATFYFALTGRPPFEASDPLALINAHMAFQPRPPHELRPDLPHALSRIVLKLLEKEPEERYQSSRALGADLRICREQFAREGRIADSLSLGSSEAPDRPRFAPRLYGREAETAMLRDLYARARAGSAQILMLAGEPGAGKSALVDALRPELARTHGYLVVGKFDLARDRPYAAWAAALAAFVQQLLVESDSHLAHWRQLLRESLGNIAQVLVELVPDLQFVLGNVPAVPELGPRETQARLALALQRFLGACACPDHPLVLFLDDLQWSDGASRDLLEALVVQGSGVALLIVGAYRANEVAAEHPLVRCLERLAQRDIAVQIIAMHSLSSEATVAMLADALDRSPADVRGLAELIERKTGNAPLFVRQFVEHLHSQGLLRYEAGTGWSWDPAAVAAADIPDGVVGLMTAKLHRLERAERSLIELASCVGDEFDAELLCQLSSLERKAIEQGLYRLSGEGLIAPCPSGFRFVHDRIREAARQLLSAQAQAKLHCDIGRLLLARIPEGERPARIFEIAEHLNGGLACLPESERLPALRINLDAGRRALAAGAAASAEGFLEVGRRLLRPDDWSTELALGYELLLLSIDSAFLRSQFPDALSLADALDQQTLSRMQRAQVAAKRIQILVLTRGPQEGALYALAVLRKLGVRWSLPSRWRAVVRLRAVAWRMRGRRLEAALRPARAPDPRWVAPIVLLSTAGASLGRTDAYLAALVISWVASSNLRRGHIARPAFTLIGFASYLQCVAGDAAEAERIETAALAWQTQFPDPVFGPRSEMTMHATMRPWRMARRRALAPLEGVADALQEVGDVEYSYYARFLKAFYSALAGDPAGSAVQRLAEIAEGVRRNRLVYPEPELCQRPFRLLGAPDACALEAEIAASEAEIAATRGSAEMFLRTAWMLVLCVYGRFDLALAQSQALGDRLFRVVPYVHVADHMLYRGLAAAALASAARGGARRRHRRVLQQCLRRLQRWAKAGPDFVHMAQLLEAERLRLAGDTRRARSLYERAAQRAKQQEFPNCAALAHERLGRMLLDLRRRTEASSALAQAAALYREWGATAKAGALDAE